MNVPADPSASSPEPGPGRPPAHSPAGWAQQPEAPRSAKARRWWLVGLIAGWALLLVIISVFSVRRDRPTVAEQLDAGAATQAVDRAAGALVSAVGPGRVFTLGPVVRQNCRVNPMRPGVEISRELSVPTTAAEAAAVLNAIGAALPADYRAEVRQSRSGLVLRADAGDFVAVRGSVVDGVITLRAESGCRPL